MARNIMRIHWMLSIGYFSLDYNHRIAANRAKEFGNSRNFLNISNISISQTVCESFDLFEQANGLQSKGGLNSFFILDACGVMNLH